MDRAGPFPLEVLEKIMGKLTRRDGENFRDSRVWLGVGDAFWNTHKKPVPDCWNCDPVRVYDACGKVEERDSRCPCTRGMDAVFGHWNLERRGRGLARPKKRVIYMFNSF
jgi:hypothetical protein